MLQIFYMTFKAKTDDIPEVSKAIFITKIGFQSGAIKYAKSHGIELRESEDYDWEGLVKIISGKIIYYMPKSLEIVDIKVNKDWALKNNIDKIKFNFQGEEDKFSFYDNTFKEKFTLCDLKKFTITRRKKWKI